MFDRERKVDRTEISALCDRDKNRGQLFSRKKNARERERESNLLCLGKQPTFLWERGTGQLCLKTDLLCGRERERDGSNVDV